VKIGCGSTSVTLVLDGYQLPATSMDAFDRNWLYLPGSTRTERGEWSFRDPCLLTSDVPHVSGWLRRVVEGLVQAEKPADPGPDLVFLEPELALSLECRNDDTARVRVYLSMAARPPWLIDSDDYEIWKFFVPLSATFGDLLTAADEWDTESAAFPSR
jgi:hypothetical protein